MRKIVIYSSSKYRIPKSIQKELAIRNTTIEYIHIDEDSLLEAKLELYGYDGGLKYEVKNIQTQNQFNKALKTFIDKIDKMPMGLLEKQSRKIRHNTMNKVSKTRKNLLHKCGLPDIPETRHCFADSTHHTCCMLGSKAREYADSSGNPIGSLSTRVKGIKNIQDLANKKKYFRKTNKQLTPWCTCTGSKVCSYYTNKFGTTDGTHIKFISTLSSSSAKNSDARNEEKAISKLDIFRHRTPGIISS